MCPYLRAANVNWSGIVLDDVKEMDFTPEEQKVYRLVAGDILVGEASGSRPEVGKSAVWRNEIPGACFQNTLIRVRPNETVTSEYLQGHLHHDARAGRLAEISRGVGIHHLSAQGLKTWTVSVPPLNEQKRIVAKIDALTEKSRKAREALADVPDLLDKLRQSILAAAFRGDLTKRWREQNPNVEPATMLLERIRTERRKKWEEAELAKFKAKGKVPTDDQWKSKYVEPEPVDTDGLSELPDGWCWAELNSLCDPDRGIPYGIVQTGDPVASGTPTVRCGDIKNFRINLQNLKLVDPEIAANYERTRLDGTEVLLAIRGTVGASAAAQPEMAGMNISREVAMIPPLPGLDRHFLTLLLASPDIQGAIGARVKGVAQSGINLSDLRTLPIPLPPAAEQAAVIIALHQCLGDPDSWLVSINSARAEIDRLDASVLAKAFRGELVPQDPNDEPASVLLARIRAERNAGAGKATTRGRGKAKPSAV
jgi:type I restriction enzyme S subunit